MPIIKETGTIEINGYRFTAIPGLNYRCDYPRLLEEIESGRLAPEEVWPEVIQKDLFFIIYFVMGCHIANHPFWVNAVRAVEDGPRTNTLDLWSRGHGKSTSITIAETIQDLMVNPEERVCIFSYVKGAAQTFLRAIKITMETSQFLQQCFPHILYDNPSKQALKWSEFDGLYVKRRSVSAKEASVEAHGLVDGMPTGRHPTKRVYDDIVTKDLVNTPEVMEKVKSSFDMSQNLGAAARKRVIGTFYHHDDPLVYISKKRRRDGSPLYHMRKYPATVNGDPNGAPVFLTDEQLDEIRMSNMTHFYTQQLLDPTPRGTAKLDRGLLRVVDMPPEGLFKFMVVDPAGTSGKRADGRESDSWAVFVVGVQPFRDDLGASDIYVLDGVVKPMAYNEAANRVVDMYIRAGRVRSLGIEKVGAQSFEIHVLNALRARGVNLSEEAGTFKVLSPRGRKKDIRIEENLVWPLVNGKIYVSTSVPPEVMGRIGDEMDKFPYWKDDALDALSYVYDMLKGYKFPALREAAEAPDRWRRKSNILRPNWMIA